MPYPSETPVNKHDLVGVRALVKSADGNSLAPETRFASTTDLFDSLQHGVDPQSLRLLSPVFSYADAPRAPEPLSRALIMVGVANTSLSAVRKLVDAEDVPSCIHKCTIAVKRADPQYASHLSEQDVVNSHTFAKFMRLLREENSVVILGKDKHQRFGILVPLAVPVNGDSSYTADELVATLYVGDMEQVKQSLAAGPSSSGGGDQLSGNKRKLSDASDGNEFHADLGAAAAAKAYLELTRSLDTRADSVLYHMRSYNN